VLKYAIQYINSNKIRQNTIQIMKKNMLMNQKGGDIVKGTMSKSFIQIYAKKL